eukprot:m.165070 g.165070  ORF g.165070 m.165070 type:complete len:131 (+) comp24964_c0_seq1:10309-10701(+)
MSQPKLERPYPAEPPGHHRRRPLIEDLPEDQKERVRLTNRLAARRHRYNKGRQEAARRALSEQLALKNHDLRAEVKQLQHGKSVYLQMLRPLLQSWLSSLDKAEDSEEAQKFATASRAHKQMFASTALPL